MKLCQQLHHLYSSPQTFLQIDCHTIHAKNLAMIRYNIKGIHHCCALPLTWVLAANKKRQMSTKNQGAEAAGEKN
jgi:hypothetical protein